MNSIGKYTNGTLFLVPLKDFGFVQGLVCRHNAKGTVFARFFPPRLRNNRTQMLPVAETSVFCGRVGDLGLRTGAWPIIGRLSDFDFEKWPLPKFVRLAGNVPHVVTYDDQLKIVSDCIAAREDLTGTECDDGLMGHGFVEIKLTRLFENEKEGSL